MIRHALIDYYGFTVITKQAHAATPYHGCAAANGIDMISHSKIDTFSGWVDSPTTWSTPRQNTNRMPPHI